jgi:hypothetical protein
MIQHKTCDEITVLRHKYSSLPGGQVGNVTIWGTISEGKIYRVKCVMPVGT